MRFERLLAEPVRNGIYKPKQFHGRGAKIVNMGELFAHPRLHAIQMKRVELSESETERFTLSKGDLLFARRSLVAEGAGKCSVVLDVDGPTTFESSIIRARPDTAKADPLFLYYFFNSALGLHCLDSIRRQVAVAGITGGDLSALEIPAPPLLQQRAIAHILGTLDDKIELNRRMTETLEAMARALFKSWFVDFDPVRAKAEGRDPGLPNRVADLFPARLVDSELGEIPEGWEVKTIGDLLELRYGKALKAEHRHDGHVAVYGSNGQVGWHDEPLAKGPGIVVGRKGNPGVVTWAPTDYFVIDTAFYVVPTKTCRSLHFLFHSLKAHDLASLGADSAVPGLNRNLAYMSTQLLPSAPLLEKFDAHASALAARGHACVQESRTLAALRDTLLPKLISGEVRVRDAERLMKRAV
jgi:type I restriction enzyme S subunit